MQVLLSITGEMRHHLKHEVDHVSHLLSSQGPMSTFIHHNTLHGLQHLPFEEALAEGQRVLGGRSYLPNEEYRRFYASGRITDEDIRVAMKGRPSLSEGGRLAIVGGRPIEIEAVCRIHLLHGIEAVDPARLRFEVYERDATRRFRGDVPAEARAAVLGKAAAELARSLDRVGLTWTLSDWMQAHTNLDVPGWLRAEVARQVKEGPHAPHGDAVESRLKGLAIPADRWEGYLGCIDRQFDGAFDGAVGRDEVRRIWLREEAGLLKKLARRHFGLRGTFSTIASHFGNNPEAYALLSLWHACLASYGLEDPFSPTNPQHFQEQDPDRVPELLHEQFRHLERWGGPPIPLTPELRAAIQAVVETELAHLQESTESDDVPALEAAHLCWIVLHDLGTTGLNRRGLEALEALVSLRVAAIAERIRRAAVAAEPAATVVALQEKQAEYADLPTKLRQRDPRRQMLQFAEETLAEEMRRLGRDLSHSDFLKELTGEDLSERVNRYMIKRCAAFLDEGLAAWRMPGRALGFYDGWRSLASSDRSFEFEDLPGWRDALHHLPALAEDAVIHRLHDLGVREEHWGEYLGRLLVQLPGWAGMISWRANRPQYPRQQVQPIDLIQYLAVRLFYETLLIQKVCKTTWQLDGSVDSLHHYFRTHLSEFFVRRELYLGHLPEYLAQQARALAGKSSSGGEEDDHWKTLTDMIWMYRESGASGQESGPTAHGSAWRLSHLAQFLGLTADEVRSLSPEERDRLIGALDAFPASAHGPVWLVAYEHHYREQILNALASNRGRGRWKTRDARPRAQVVFCIDEREEAIHRHLEELDSGLETLGAAGFFGVAMNYRGLDDHDTTPLCPPVITPIHTVDEVARPDEAERFETHTRRAKWYELVHNTYWEVKRNVVSAYFLLDLIGFLQAVPLFGQILAPLRYARASQRVDRQIVPPVRTALAVTRQAEPDGALEDHAPLGFTAVEQADRVEAMLRNLGLTSGLARLVVFTGHGSSSLNNPHESAHDCGACGGKHGGASARAFAALANRSEVRSLLRERGIEIPDDTWFVGSQHNTCSELYTYFDIEDSPATHREEWRRLVADLDEARARSAQERCRRFASAPKDASLERSLRHIEGRSVDLSQVRPEWGHATNACAVVGRRSITQGVFLDRRAFVISYDPTQDPDGRILERILLAVGPVGAGINLEYYFSTVDNRKYGCDTKVPHNVYGLIGVMEGAMSDLRTGLPKQMVEVHEPMRLQLIVEASTAVLGEIYGRQAAIQELLGNAWVHLVAMDPETGDFHLFVPGVGFVLWDQPLTPLPEVQSSFEWYKGKTDFLAPALIVQDGGRGQSAGATQG
ncbi:MAG: DUF2309 family protein [Chloroflexi bacterium]|nr:DUF2309 family protein [Chloroflexota bacterium]